MKQTDFASAGQNSKHRVLPPAGPIEGIDKIIDISYAECVSAQWPYTQWVTDVNYSFDLQQGLSFSHWVVDWTIWQWKHYKHLFTWYIGQQSKNAVEWRLFSISHCPPTPIWTIQHWWIVQLTLSLSLFETTGWWTCASFLQVTGWVDTLWQVLRFGVSSNASGSCTIQWTINHLVSRRFVFTDLNFLRCPTKP